MASLYLTLHTEIVKFPDQAPVSLTVRDYSQAIMLRDDIPHHTSQLSRVHRLWAAELGAITALVCVC